MVYRLFLSHSSPEPAAQQRLEDLADAIKNAATPDEDIEVLYDAGQIATADHWRERIAFMLQVCHGAVVLLDEAAINSKWVLAEATFASIRHTHDPKFVCVPVSFLDKGDLEETKAARQRQRDALHESDWSVAALDQIQFAKGKDVAQIGSDILQALRRKDLLHPDNPIDRLAQGLATLLAQAPNDCIDELAAELQRASTYLSADRRCQAALTLVKRMLHKPRLKATRDALDVFGLSFAAANITQILDLLSPLVLPAEASELLHRRRESGGYAHASICFAHPPFFIKRYVQRAHLPRRPPPIVTLENTYGSFPELQARLREHWREQQSADAPELTDEEVDEDLRRSDGVYAFVPGPVQEDVITQLERIYEKVGFIVYHTYDDAPTALPPNVLPIRPALTADEEARIIQDYRAATVSLGGGN